MTYYDAIKKQTTKLAEDIQNRLNTEGNGVKMTLKRTNQDIKIYVQEDYTIHFEDKSKDVLHFSSLTEVAKYIITNGYKTDTNSRKEYNKVSKALKEKLKENDMRITLKKDGMELLFIKLGWAGAEYGLTGDYFTIHRISKDGTKQFRSGIKGTPIEELTEVTWQTIVEWLMNY